MLESWMEIFAQVSAESRFSRHEIIKPYSLIVPCYDPCDETIEIGSYYRAIITNFLSFQRYLETRFDPRERERESAVVSLIRFFFSSLERAPSFARKLVTPVQSW